MQLEQYLEDSYRINGRDITTDATDIKRNQQNTMNNFLPNLTSFKVTVRSTHNLCQLHDLAAIKSL